MESPLYVIASAMVAALIGGVELRIAVHRLGRRIRHLETRISAVETPKPDSWGYPTIGARGAGLVLVTLAFLGLGGCTQADLDRAQQLADAADAKLAAAQSAEDAARSTLATAQQLAEASNSDKARAAIASAKAALDATDASLAVAKDAAKAGHSAVDAAKVSQAAGASTFNVLLAAATALVPTLGGLIGAIGFAVKNAQAFRQTVVGIEKAKASMSPESVAALHIELSSAQDESTKAAVNRVQDAAASKGT